MSKVRRFTTKCHPILERERDHKNLEILFHCIIYVNVKKNCFAHNRGWNGAYYKFLKRTSSASMIFILSLFVQHLYQHCWQFLLNWIQQIFISLHMFIYEILVIIIILLNKKKQQVPWVYEAICESNQIFFLNRIILKYSWKWGS